MEESRAGMMARSKAGHDRGRIYLILSADEQYAYLVDGRLRTVDRPKKKKWMHIQIIRETPQELLRKLELGERIMDEEVKRAIGGLRCQRQM